MDKTSEMLVEVRSNKTVKYSNVNAVWSCLLGCQSILAQEPCSSRLRGTVTFTLIENYVPMICIYLQLIVIFYRIKLNYNCIYNKLLHTPKLAITPPLLEVQNSFYWNEIELFVCF